MAKSDSVPHVVRQALNQREVEYLCPIGAFSQQGIRRLSDPHEDPDFRQSFSIDGDRILHSLAYTRYIDKTQVFYLVQNDHITHRVLHVQLVSKIARTIGRFLGLNEDLIEAISLGHDIGHSPFGHDGETFLSEICRANGVGSFLHNLQGVQFLDRVERKGKGWNLCLQTLDGILCHDGEIHNQRLEPSRAKTFETFQREIAAKRNDPAVQLVPMTLEGCVVRMADTVSYIGRDIEDAIRLNMIRRSDLPSRSVKILGNTNGTIVYRLVTDIIQNSFQNPYAALSPEVSEALESLKAFNLERIYLNPDIKSRTAVIRNLFHLLFERYLTDIENENEGSVIFSGFLKDMSDDYIHGHRPAEIVRDFIAGMTDRFFLAQCPEALRPSPQPF
jgi:dGTPase